MTFRLLSDESVNGFVVRAMSATYDVLTAAGAGLSGRPDLDVAQRSAGLGRIVVTEDRGFARNVIGTPHPGLIVLELNRYGFAEQVELAMAALLEPPQNFAKRITIIRKSGMRQRSL